MDFSSWWDNEIMLIGAKNFLSNYKGERKEVYHSTVDRASNTVYLEKYNPSRTIWKYEKEKVFLKLAFG
ncbi:hypothetical protein [Xanthovirga aplysinae]|uniref:hypothetical protein n=1 Tax=Xanthovirga aplysinae TaxID=2529853 RepID=UPI001CA46A92|nr:hypothetical protein [Xanthovirga aplysinae]